MNDPTRILLVDDHALFRAGLRSLLEAETASFEVVGEASDGEEAIEKARALQPDIIVMDLSMPKTDGLEATRRISSMELDTRILVLTVHAEEEFLAPVITAGARGYLTKTSADAELVEALRVVRSGQVYLPAEATTVLARRYAAPREDEAAGLEELSDRETQVLALTAEGYSSREIGEKLDISPKTVETYRERAMAKLGLGHRSEVVRFALRTGLLTDI